MRTTHLLLLLVTIHCTAAQRGADQLWTGDNQQQIFNGEDTSKGEFPFMVRILKSSGEHTCGGSLIEPRIVLTAAHCLVEGNTPLKNMKVVVGDWNSEEVEETEEVYTAVRSIIHPDYHDSDYSSDIALLVLEKEVQVGKGVEVIALPTDRSLYKTGTPVTIIGWGLTESGDLSEVLQKHEYEISDQDKCKEYWEKQQVRIEEGTICSGKPPMKGFANSGDSGGPLFVKQNDKFVLLGLTSWGTETQTSDSYDVSTDVQFYKNWIKNNVGMALGDQWIELQGGDFNHGVVVLHDKSEVHTVCSDEAGKDEVAAICKQLGYKNGARACATEYYPKRRRKAPVTFPPMARTEMECGSGAEDVWEDCKMKKYPEEATVPCFARDELAVKCYADAPFKLIITNITSQLKYLSSGYVKGKVKCKVIAKHYGYPLVPVVSLVNVEGTNVTYVQQDIHYKPSIDMFIAKLRRKDKVKVNCLVGLAYLQIWPISPSPSQFYTVKADEETCEDPSAAEETVREWWDTIPPTPPISPQ